MGQISFGMKRTKYKTGVIFVRIPWKIIGLLCTARLSKYTWRRNTKVHIWERKSVYLLRRRVILQLGSLEAGWKSSLCRTKPEDDRISKHLRGTSLRPVHAVLPLEKSLSDHGPSMAILAYTPKTLLEEIYYQNVTFCNKDQNIVEDTVALFSFCQLMIWNRIKVTFQKVLTAWLNCSIFYKTYLWAGSGGNSLWGTSRPVVRRGKHLVAFWILTKREEKMREVYFVHD